MIDVNVVTAGRYEKAKVLSVNGVCDFTDL